jgi:hypothetical protein
MRYIKGIVSNENVQELIVSTEGIIEEVVSVVTPRLLTANSVAVKNSLSTFAEGDLLETFENIRSFAENDMATFIGCIADVLSDTVLTNEDKVAVINFALDDTTDGQEDELVGEGSGTKAAIGGAVGAAGALGAKHLKDKFDASKFHSFSGKAKDALGDTAGGLLAKGRTALGGMSTGKKVALAAGTAAVGYGAYKGAKAIKGKMAARKAAKDKK